MSNSDEKVYNATVATLNIFEKHRKMKDNSSASSSTEIDSTHSLPLDLHNKALDISNKNCLEYQNTVEALEVLNMMYSFFHEKNPEHKDNTLLDVMKSFADITSPPIIGAQIEKIKTLLDHITIISSNGAKLKQVLRNNILNDFWRVNVDYQKSVVRFFTLAQEITKDINHFITSIEKSKEHNPNRLQNLHSLENKLTVELQTNLDILIEFRNYIQSSVTQDLPTL